MGSKNPVVGVAGLGYMGLATALAFAHHGRTTVGFEILPERRAQLRAGKLPLHEPGLGRLLKSGIRSGRFRVVDSWAELVQEAQVIFLCIQTPPRPSGTIDLGPMRRALRQLGRALRSIDGHRTIVVKSTVVPGTTTGVIEPSLRRYAGARGAELGVAANPEFLAEGSMVRDALRPDRIVLGVASEKDRKRLRQIYAGFQSPLVFLRPTEAELVKYASNAALALRVAFANEISRMAEPLGGDVDAVMGAVGRDPRIGDRFLSAGPGFGGSCFEKDLRALVARARDVGATPELLRSILRSNDVQSSHAAEIVRNALGGDLHGRRIALLGLSFKAGTDDVRETRALPLAHALVASGAELHAHDPVAGPNFAQAWANSGGSSTLLHIESTPQEALRNADAAVIQVAWPVYAQWPAQFSRLMRRPLVVDLRRAISARRRASADIEWVGLGVGTNQSTQPADYSKVDATGLEPGSRATVKRGASAS